MNVTVHIKTRWAALADETSVLSGNDFDEISEIIIILEEKEDVRRSLRKLLPM